MAADARVADLLIQWKPKKITAHEVSAAQVNVSDLRSGRSLKASARTFRGRPLIAGALFEAMQRCAQQTRPQQGTIVAMYGDLVFFFMFLDEMEDTAGGKGTGFPPLESVWQIPGQVWDLFTEWLKAGGADRAHFVYSTCRRIFSVAARIDNPHSIEFFLPPNPFRNPQKIRNRGLNSKTDEMDLDLDSLRTLSATLRAQMEMTEGRFSRAQRLVSGEEHLPAPADMSAVTWPQRREAVAREMSIIEAEIEVDKGFYPRKLSGLEVYRRAGFHGSKPLWKNTSLLQSQMRDFVERMNRKIRHVCPANDEYEWHVWARSLEALRRLGESKGWSIASMHAGSGARFNIGEARPATVQQIVEGLHAFVPRKNDMRAAIALFLLYTGWNLSTVLDMDADNWWRPHPSHPDILAQLYSPKARAKGGIQHAYSLKSKAYRPFDIVQRVLRWTEPLRSSLRLRLAELDQLLREDPNDPNLLEEHAQISGIVKRVWLFLNLDGGIVSADKSDMRWSWVNLLFEKADVKVGGDLVKFSQGLSRKSFAVFVYETSGHNLIVTQVALGHKDFSSLLAYLDRKRIRSSNRRSWFRLQVEVLNGLEKGALMSAILAKKLRTGSVSEAELEMLEQRSARSRQGFGCADPLHPDNAADPGHRDGEVCREQRCLTGCSKAFATWDTAQWLALYILELRRKRDQTPVPLWLESDDDIDLRVAEDLLGCYSESNQTKAFLWAERKLQQRPLFFTIPGTRALRAARVTSGH